jgi:hypothetical protein
MVVRKDITDSKFGLTRVVKLEEKDEESVRQVRGEEETNKQKWDAKQKEKRRRNASEGTWAAAAVLTVVAVLKAGTGNHPFQSNHMARY